MIDGSQEEMFGLERLGDPPPRGRGEHKRDVVGRREREGGEESVRVQVVSWGQDLIKDIIMIET